ncbi:MAG: hypothetical protein ABIP48_26435 [Planctomycetota bacterium]
MISEPPRTVPWKLRLKWLRDRPVALVFGLMAVFLPLVIVPLQYLMMSQIAGHLLRHVDYEALARQGKDAAGEVVAVRTDPAETVLGGHPWVIEYRFAADTGERRDWMKTLDGDVVSDWEEGQPVNVKYLETESMISDVRPHQFTLYHIWLICVCGWMAIGLPFILYAFAGMRKKVRLCRDGTLTAGAISAMHLATWLGFMPLVKFRFKVTYRFPDHDGKEVLGASISTNVALLNGGKQGDPVDILFLESRPEVNCLAEEHDLLALPDNAQHRASPRDHLTQ